MRQVALPFVPPYIPFDKRVNYTELPPYRRSFDCGLPILMYHKIGTPLPETRFKDLYVDTFCFKKQLSQLKKAGFRAITLDNWATFSHPNDRRFVLTFDDGSRTVFRSACHSMSEAGFTAIQYIVANQIGGKNEWDTTVGELEDPLMSDGDICEWLAAGHQIGSHTLNHPRLAQLTPENAREEIFSSKKKLEDQFGIPIRHFCYPYGSWASWVRDLVEEAGYETGVTTECGLCSDIKDPFIMPRLMVHAVPPRTWRTFLMKFRH